MIGVVLAAGDATRLPNKLLLPTHECRPMILSGIEYLRRNKVEEIRVVVPPDGAVKHFLKRYYTGNQSVRLITQVSPKGVFNAIKHGILKDDSADETLVIVCGDNVYPALEKIPTVNPPFVVARRVPADRAKHLVQWDPVVYRWIRNGSPTSDPICLTTPWVFNVGEVRDLHLENCAMDRMDDILNECIVDPTEMPTDGWWDLGTYETFREYWRT